MTETPQQRTERLQAEREQRKRDRTLQSIYVVVKEMRSMLRELYADHIEAQRGAKK